MRSSGMFPLRKTVFNPSIPSRILPLGKVDLRSGIDAYFVGPTRRPRGE